MNKIPSFFRKPKTQTGEAIQSPTKQVLTPAELDKLKNKIRTEIATAELRIKYLTNKTSRSKESDRSEIEHLQKDIENLTAKYAELIDPRVNIYKAGKQILTKAVPNIDEIEPTPNLEDHTAVEPKENNARNNLFDTLIEENDIQEPQATRKEIVITECAKCRARITFLEPTEIAQCMLCKTTIKVPNQTNKTEAASEEQDHAQRVIPVPNAAVLQLDPADNSNTVQRQPTSTIIPVAAQPQPTPVIIQAVVPPLPVQAIAQQVVHPQPNPVNNQIQPIIFGHLFDEDTDEEEDLEMALTKATVNAWQAAVDRQAEILENGLGIINAQSAKKEIPTFNGEIEGKLAIEEWFKIAERIATNAEWTEEQKLRFFQEKLTKSAANFNDSLTQAQKATYQIWKNHILEGLADNTTKARKKEQLKHSNKKIQKESETLKLE